MRKRLFTGLGLVILILSFSFITAAAEDYSRTASGSEFHAVLQEGMEPVHAESVKEGNYEITVHSSSNYFRINNAVLHVHDGQMSAELTISGSSYECLYPGSGAEAAAAGKEDYLFLENRNGESVVTIPVPALSQILPCASFSKGRHRWYDRNLVFNASSLPAEALDVTLPVYGEWIDPQNEPKGDAAAGNGTSDKKEASLKSQSDSAESTISSGQPKAGNSTVKAGTSAAETERSAVEAGTSAAETEKSAVEAGTSAVETERSAVEAENSAAEAGPQPAEINQKDGEYSIEVMLTGGSGRASVSSPAWFYVRNGKAYAKLLWSSVYYDYLILDGTTYYNETTDGGNSSFTIPVTAFDEEIRIIADTTAMGDPVEIEYALTFYRDTIGNKGQVPQEGAKRVLAIAAAIIILGGLLNWIVKKKMGRY